MASSSGAAYSELGQTAKKPRKQEASAADQQQAILEAYATQSPRSQHQAVSAADAQTPGLDEERHDHVGRQGEEVPTAVTGG